MDRYNQKQNSKPWNESSYYQGWDARPEQYNRGLELASPPHKFTPSGPPGDLRPPPLPPSLPSFGREEVNPPPHQETSSSPLKFPVEDRSSFPTFRFMKFKKEIWISSNDIRNPLTYQQISTLMDQILERVLTAEGEMLKPRFFGVKILDGRLLIFCGDNTTIYWLKKVVKELSATYPMGLQVSENDGEVTKYTLVANFQNSLNDSNERILTFLKNQNEGLDVSRWEVVGRASKKLAVQLTILIDYDSAELLRRKGERLNYKFGVTRMLLENQYGGKLKDDQLENDLTSSSSPQTSTSRINNPIPFVNKTTDPDGLANTAVFTGSQRKPMSFRNKLKKLRKKQNRKLNRMTLESQYF